MLNVAQNQGRRMAALRLVMPPGTYKLNTYGRSCRRLVQGLRLRRIRVGPVRARSLSLHFVQPTLLEEVRPSQFGFKTRPTRVWHGGCPGHERDRLAATAL